MDLQITRLYTNQQPYPSAFLLMHVAHKTNTLRRVLHVEQRSGSEAMYAPIRPYSRRQLVPLIHAHNNHGQPAQAPLSMGLIPAYKRPLPYVTDQPYQFYSLGRQSQLLARYSSV